MPQPVPEAEDAIRSFFSDPTTPPNQALTDGQVSVLYLLRRELIETLGYQPDTDAEATVYQNGSRNRLFASLILMFTAVDLLAKFTSDADGVGKRFVAFLRAADGGGLTEGTAKLFWAARNSLVHQFSVPPEESLKKLGLRSVAFAQRKEVSPGGWDGLMVVEGRGETAIVYVDGVLRCVLDAIRRYRESLYGSDSGPARSRFLQQYAEFGTLGMTID